MYIREGDEKRKKRRRRRVRNAQKSLQLLVMARCGLRDKSITERREEEKRKMRNTAEKKISSDKQRNGTRKCKWKCD